MSVAGIGCVVGESPYCGSYHYGDYVDEVQEDILECRRRAIARGWEPDYAECTTVTFEDVSEGGDGP